MNEYFALIKESGSDVGKLAMIIMSDNSKVQVAVATSFFSTSLKNKGFKTTSTAAMSGGPNNSICQDAQFAAETDHDCSSDVLVKETRQLLLATKIERGIYNWQEDCISELGMRDYTHVIRELKTFRGCWKRGRNFQWYEWMKMVRIQCMLQRRDGEIQMKRKVMHYCELC